MKDMIDEIVAYVLEALEKEASKKEEDGLGEVAPPGYEKVVKALKKEKEVENPYAVAWAMKKKEKKQ